MTTLDSQISVGSIVTVVSNLFLWNKRGDVKDSNVLWNAGESGVIVGETSQYYTVFLRTGVGNLFKAAVECQGTYVRLL